MCLAYNFVRQAVSTKAANSLLQQKLPLGRAGEVWERWAYLSCLHAQDAAR